MANMIFDFTNLTITAADFADVGAEKDIYSTWKRLLLTGPPALNAGAPPAFDVSVGGNPIGGGQEISPYFFVRNDLGWRLRPTTGSGELTINGNLFAFDLTVPLFISNGAGTVLIKQVVSPQSITDAGATAALEELVRLGKNKMRTNPITGMIEILSEIDDTTVILQGDLFEDFAETQRYRGQGAEVRGRMAAP
jgi:hypothetical protein